MECRANPRLGLFSGNELLMRASKVWVTVPPEDGPKLEDFLARQCAIEPMACSQFVRHFGVILTPHFLDRAGMRYRVVTQLPGQIVVTLPGTYHQVINQGANIAVAVNFCANVAGIVPAKDYQPCSAERKCGTTSKQFQIPVKETFDELNRHVLKQGVDFDIDWAVEKPEERLLPTILEQIERIGHDKVLELLNSWLSSSEVVSGECAPFWQGCLPRVPCSFAC